VIYPLCWLFAGLIALLIGLDILLYFTSDHAREVDRDTAEAFMILFSYRYRVFQETDIAALKHSEAGLEAFAGDEQAAYQELLPLLPEGLSYISTGCCDEHGNLLFRGFETEFFTRSGTLFYRSFQGLYTAGQEGVRYIPPEDCAPYAPAVLKLYYLSTIDGSIE